MVSQGLKPHHSFLDIGCGVFRGGVRFIPYLDPGGYWGIDKNELLLQIGWDLELKRYGLTDRQPRAQLVCLADFEFERLPARFDYAIAQSLFTHLSLNRVRRCLAKLANSLRPGARLFATIFEIGDDEDREQPKTHLADTVSHSARSFYHYSRRDLMFAIQDLPYALESIAGWGHPRGQRMVTFRRD